MTDNNLRISFDYRYPDEAALIVYSTFEGGYLGGEPTISLRKVITGDEAVELYSKLAGKTVEYVKKKAGYIDDESKFEPPKAEPDGYTKKLFGMPCKGEEIMSEKSCKLCDLYGICGARTAGCVKDPDEGCPFYRYFKKIFQPTTKNNLGVDCISRQALLNATVKKSSIWNHITNSEGDNLEAIVSKLPPITPQPRKGHWIECMPGGAEEWCYKCSECNFWKYKKTINLSKFKFCPNCGAKMVEPQESEDK